MANGTFGVSGSPIASTAISGEYGGFGLRAAIVSSESQDVVSATVEIPKYLDLSATESSDTASLSTDLISLTEVTLSEPQDSVDLQVRNNPENYMGIAGVPIATTAISGDIPNTFTYGVIFTSLGSSEASDTASFEATKNEIADLTATESSDSLSASVQEQTPASLSATEATDSASVALGISDFVSLEATEAQDTASFESIRGHLSSLEASESPDTFDALVAAGDTIITFVNATEAADGFSASMLVSLSAQVASSEQQDVFSGALSLLDTASLAASEQGDTFSGSMLPGLLAGVAASEPQDTAFFSTGLGAALAGLEAQDIANLQASVAVSKAQQAQFFMLFRS